MSDKIYTIDEIKNLLEDVFRKKYDVKSVTLFGSYARGEQVDKSDIDLVIDSDGKLINLSFYGLLEDVVQRLNKNIDMFEISEIRKPSSIWDKISSEGVVIYER